MNRKNIDHCVETLSLKGCAEVWRVIAELETGHVLPETAALTEAERQAVLAELKSIMAVYQERK